MVLSQNRTPEVVAPDVAGFVSSGDGMVWSKVKRLLRSLKMRTADALETAVPRRWLPSLQRAPLPGSRTAAIVYPNYENL